MLLQRLSRQIDFSAMMHFRLPGKDLDQSIQHYGSYAQADGFGHNYSIKAVWQGEIDPLTGMIVNLMDIDHVLNELVEKFDHYNLNVDVAEFQDKIPTLEHFTFYLWSELQKKSQELTAKLERITVNSSPDWTVECIDGQTLILWRHWWFSAFHRLYSKNLSDKENDTIYSKCSRSGGHGHDYPVSLGILCRNLPTSGWIISRDLLNQMVDKWKSSLHGKNLNLMIEGKVPTSENLIQYLSELIKKDLVESTILLKLEETRKNHFMWLDNGVEYVL